jgi:dUTP pyrophosphatase
MKRMNLRVKIKRLHDASVIPQYAREGDAGFDLVAVEDTVIEPGETKIVPTGIAISLPPGYEAQIRPRSGITVKTKLRVQLGTIDSGYVGEIGVIVDNIAFPSLYINENYNTIGIAYEYKPKTIEGTWDEPYDLEQEHTYIIRKGDRIAQAVIAPVEQAVFTEVDELDVSERGAQGFGSSGVKSKEENE